VQIHKVFTVVAGCSMMQRIMQTVWEKNSRAN